MGRKISPVRIAFFRALGETGNRTLAAERARVSRDWVRWRRLRDPDFAAREKVVMAEAGERLRTATSIAPAGTWWTQAGEELAVRGSRARVVQIQRARLKQWTPRVEARFLAGLIATCNVSAACRAVGMSVSGAYKHYARWRGFAERWDAALATGYDRLEMALVENAHRALGEAPDYPPDIAIAPMTFEEALRLLRLHTARVRGGRVRRGDDPHGPMSASEVLAELTKRLAAKRRAMLAEAGAAGAIA